MFHVHIVCEPYGPTPHTATFVRSLLPLTHPVNASAISVTHSSEYRKADALLVERAWAPNREAAQFLVARARIDRTPVIYTTDDNLVDLDPSVTRGYLTPAHIAGAEYLAREASGIIVSTEPLRRRMAEYNSQAVVWQTALNPVIALELLANRTWSGTGVLGPEAFDAKPFLELLAAPAPAGYGSPWGIEEKPIG